jgi:restriction endonuclease S subunit
VGRLQSRHAADGKGVIQRVASPALRRFKPYSAYKDSGVEWLGQIPAHWEVKRLKAVATVQLSNVDKKSVDGQESVWLCNYTDVYYNERITSDIEFMSATATREQVQRFSLRAGDVLITKDSESWTDIAVPAVVAEDMPEILCGYHLAHVRPASGYVGAFLSRAFAAIGPRDQFQVAANGITRFGLAGDAIRTGLFAMPPESEQRAIAAFLDRETARINALVAKKERLIELLREQRTALITHAVTKGLDPNVSMKNSDVEWLGEIPAHWEVRRLKFLLATPLKYGANEAAELDDLDLPRYVRITDIDESDGLRDETFKSLPAEVAKEYLLREGDLLFARSGATAGKSFLYRRSWGICAYAGYLIRARLDTGMACPDFVRYFTGSSSYWQWLSAVFIQATIQNVSAEKYGCLIIPQPSIPEQRAIGAFLDRETARVDALVAKVRGAIDRLKELRTALISAAVTGKIDVREEAA